MEKIENGNLPIHPMEMQFKDGSVKKTFTNFGLTKREYFAAMAMQGLLANNIYHNPLEKQQMISVPALAKAATSYADAILSELSKTEAK